MKDDEKFNTNSPVGSIHWFNTLMSNITRMAQYIGEHSPEGSKEEFYGNEVHETGKFIMGKVKFLEEWRKHDVSRHVPFQKCPVCDGEGKVRSLENKFATMPMYMPCDVCKGAKIIQMAHCA